jgi:hypothetical protein
MSKPEPAITQAEPKELLRYNRKGDYAGLDFNSLSFHFRKTPLAQWGGRVVVISVNGASSDVARADHGARLSYSLSNEICADLTCSTISCPPMLATPRNGQIYTADDVALDPAGASDPGNPVAPTSTLSIDVPTEGQ